jgi:type IV secretion system protein VirB7
MKKLAILIAIPLMLVTLTGCTTAGPFVTNISSDGRGGLNIEKARVKLNFWTNGLETCETTNSSIQLTQPTNK